MVERRNLSKDAAAAGAEVGAYLATIEAAVQAAHDAGDEPVWPAPIGVQTFGEKIRSGAGAKKAFGYLVQTADRGHFWVMFQGNIKELQASGYQPTVEEFRTDAYGVMRPDRHNTYGAKWRTVPGINSSIPGGLAYVAPTKDDVDAGIRGEVTIPTKKGNGSNGGGGAGMNPWLIAGLVAAAIIAAKS